MRARVLLPLLAAASVPAGAAELKERTREGYEAYWKATEARLDRELGRTDAFLHVETLEGKERERAFRTLRQGDIFLERLETRDAQGAEIEVPSGMVHHWLGAVFVPGARLPDAIAVVQDYDRHQDVYAPDVTRSRLLARDGNRFRILLRFHKKKVLTADFETEHDVVYRPLDERRWTSRSHTTRVVELENAGEPDERTKPEGQDRGLMWRMNTSWRFLERDGGVYLECETVSLTRDIPFALRWLVKPFVTSIPEESLRFTLGTTRDAVRKRRAAAAGAGADPAPLH